VHSVFSRHVVQCNTRAVIIMLIIMMMLMTNCIAARGLSVYLFVFFSSLDVVPFTCLLTNTSYPEKSLQYSLFCEDGLCQKLQKYA